MSQTTERTQGPTNRTPIVLDHELFKLLPAPMIKNVSFSDKPRYIELEHCHLFHSIDSTGRVQNASNAVGNHFHTVTIVKNPDGSLRYGRDGKPEIEVSPPMRKVERRTPEGRIVIETERIPYDGHRHEIEHLGSDKIQIRPFGGQPTHE